jgi:sugar phosphate isomerase/epimerase
LLTLTGFADEISPDLNEQLQVLSELGIRHLELRGVCGKNVLQWTDEEMTKVKSMLNERGFAVSSIASPIGKYPIADDFEPQLEAMNKAIRLAQWFETKYIRLFSYYIPKGENPGTYRSDVICRMSKLADLAVQSGVTLILENESGGLYGDIAERCLDILTSVNSPALRIAFDPGNFVMENVAPYTYAFEKISPFIEYVHVKDADRSNRMFVPAGAGDGEIPELIRALKQSGYSGFMSIEPHLHHAYPEKTDPERFTIAANALISLLEKENFAWN